MSDVCWSMVLCCDTGANLVAPVVLVGRPMPVHASMPQFAFALRARLRRVRARTTTTTTTAPGAGWCVRRQHTHNVLHGAAGKNMSQISRLTCTSRLPCVSVDSRNSLCALRGSMFASLAGRSGAKRLGMRWTIVYVSRLQCAMASRHYTRLCVACWVIIVAIAMAGRSAANADGGGISNTVSRGRRGGGQCGQAAMCLGACAAPMRWLTV